MMCSDERGCSPFRFSVVCCVVLCCENVVVMCLLSLLLVVNINTHREIITINITFQSFHSIPFHSIPIPIPGLVGGVCLENCFEKR